MLQYLQIIVNHCHIEGHRSVHKRPLHPFTDYILTRFWMVINEESKQRKFISSNSLPQSVFVLQLAPVVKGVAGLVVDAWPSVQQSCVVCRHLELEEIIVNALLTVELFL